MKKIIVQLSDIADLVEVAQTPELNDHQRIILLRTIDSHLQSLIADLDD